jgi:Holliday junction DNA helicase RuvA
LIAQLSGKLVHKQPNSVIIDAGGVGYEVTIPLSTFYVMGEVESQATLKIQTNVREDAIQLFGFATAAEKELFLKLTSVSGIGPKVAITLLSGLSVADLIRAIKDNDLTKLTAVPGIGRKTAERLVVELRDKLAKISIDDAAMASAQPGAGAEPAVRDDTIAALMALGYPRPVAEKAVDTALKEEGERSIEAVLKRSLRRLSR